jgi:uncharacterized protein (TIGR02284 family)
MKADNTISILNNLIATTEDGKKGFAEAANDATNPELKEIFQRRSAECKDAAIELQSIVLSIGGTPEKAGTITGAAHRRWIKVKSAVSESNTAVLEEVERGEDHAKAAYSKALKADLPSPIRTVIERQRDGAIRNHDLIRRLRDSFRKAANM